jgi:hypothetical protein
VEVVLREVFAQRGIMNDWGLKLWTGRRCVGFVNTVINIDVS